MLLELLLAALLGQQPVTPPPAAPASAPATSIDAATDTIAWELQMSAGIRPMTFEQAKDGSTSRIFVQLSDYHGIAVVDFNARKEVSRFLMADIPGEEKHTQGLQGAPAHGLGMGASTSDSTRNG